MFHVKHIEMTEYLLCHAPPDTRLSQMQADLLARHLQLVLEGNQRLNLTRITEPEEALRKHVLDSLAVARFVDDCQSGELADLGSGAGYPGIPLSIVTGRATTLVESITKKAVFLEAVVAELSLPASVAAVRAEELALVRPGAFSVVVARALTSLPSLVELAAPLLSPGGCLLALKGRLDAEEHDRGERAARIVGMRLLRTQGLNVPGTEERHLVLYESVGRPQQRLPRRPGQAQRQPLA